LYTLFKQGNKSFRISIRFCRVRCRKDVAKHDPHDLSNELERLRTVKHAGQNQFGEQYPFLIEIRHVVEWDLIVAVFLPRSEDTREIIVQSRRQLFKPRNLR